MTKKIFFTYYVFCGRINALYHHCASKQPNDAQLLILVAKAVMSI